MIFKNRNARRREGGRTLAFAHSTKCFHIVGQSEPLTLLLIVSGLMAGSAPYEGDKAVDELSKLFLRGIIRDSPAFVEDASCASHKKAPAKPGSGPLGAQHRQPRLLAQDRAEAAR